MQNIDSPSIIMLDLNCVESRALMSPKRRREASPRQSENRLERLTKFVAVPCCWNLHVRPVAHELTRFLRELVPKILEVESGPKLTDARRSDEGIEIFLTKPIPGAPGFTLRVTPPEKTDATVPSPVLHLTSLM